MSWGALFDERYRGRILMLDDPREAIGFWERMEAAALAKPLPPSSVKVSTAKAPRTEKYKSAGGSKPATKRGKVAVKTAKSRKGKSAKAPQAKVAKSGATKAVRKSAPKTKRAAAKTAKRAKSVKSRPGKKAGGKKSAGRKPARKK